MNVNFEVKHLTEVIASREDVYHFFSAFFSQPLSQNFIEKLMNRKTYDLLSEITSDKLNPQAKKALELIRQFVEHCNVDAAELLNELNVEYTRLFRGIKPDYGPPPPYEYMYRTSEPTDNLLTMHNALAYYRLANAKLMDTCRERVDHVSVELDFMRYLSVKLAQALKNSDAEAVLKYLKLQREFLNRLGTWIPNFCNKIVDSTKVTLFKGISMLLEELISSDAFFIENLYQQASKHKFEINESRLTVTTFFIKSLADVCKVLNWDANGNFLFKEMDTDDPENEVVIPTTCVICNSGCGALATVKDGLLIKLDGNSNAPVNRGKLCLKGLASIMMLYDPYRLKAPLIRTNPEKGIGVDPKWKEISWDEALNIIVERLKKLREEDPKKLLWMVKSFSHHQMSAQLWPIAFGTYYLVPVTGYGSWCGLIEHSLLENTRQSFFDIGDVSYSNYIVIIGCGQGNIAGPGAMANARVIAERKAKGAKIVVVDPRMSEIAERADRWIPILPGTESAWLLGLCHVVVYEVGKYDIEHLKNETNAVYLIDQDGYFVRDRETGKVLIWDAAEGKPKAFDDATLKDPALTGKYEVDGVKCEPAFQRFMDILKEYTPENVEKITTIPASVTREVAKEMVEHAQIGSTIELEGKTYPHRPVSILFYSGLNGHSTSTYSVMALQTLTHILGALDAVGSNLAANVGGIFGFGHLPHNMIPGKDGMNAPTPVVSPTPFKFPVGADMSEYFPLAFHVCQVAAIGLSDPERYGIKYKPEDLTVFVSGTNPLMNSINPEFMANLFKRFAFVIDYTLYLDETCDFADIVLPDVTHFERSAADNFWIGAPDRLTGLHITQPLVRPMYNGRSFWDTMMEISHKVGCLREFYSLLNNFLPNAPIEVDEFHSWEEVCDHICRSASKTVLGEELTFEDLKKTGLFYKPVPPEMKYRPYFYNGLRVPFYFNIMIEKRDELKKKFDEYNVWGKVPKEFLEWLLSDYKPLPEYKPCPPLEEAAKSPDLLLAICYRPPSSTFSLTQTNPLLVEVSLRDPRWTRIQIHEEAARRRGIKDGDLITVESRAGKVTGIAKVTRGIHPRVIAISGIYGLWAHPISKGVGVHFNTLIPPEMEYNNPISCDLEHTVAVKVYKA